MLKATKEIKCRENDGKQKNQKTECMCLCVRAQSYSNRVKTSLADSTLSGGDPERSRPAASAGCSSAALPEQPRHQTAARGAAARVPPGSPVPAQPKAPGSAQPRAPLAGRNPGPAAAAPAQAPCGRSRRHGAASASRARCPPKRREQRGRFPSPPSFPRSGGRPGNRRAGRPAPRGSTWRPGTHQLQSLPPSSASSRGGVTAPGDGSAPAAAATGAAAAAGGGAPAAAAASSMARRCPGPAPDGSERWRAGAAEAAPGGRKG